MILSVPIQTGLHSIQIHYIKGGFSMLIATTKLQSNDQGLYSFKEVNRALGLEGGANLTKFLRSDLVKKLVLFKKENNILFPIERKPGGKNGGTWVHGELVALYLMWLKPDALSMYLGMVYNYIESQNEGV